METTTQMSATDRAQMLAEPPYCTECKHCHVASEPCPEEGTPCGSYLCCIN